MMNLTSVSLTSPWRRHRTCRIVVRGLTSATSSATNRNFSFNSNFNVNDSEPPWRVAVVGGGAAGLSTALLLAPLVEAGLLERPIRVFGSSDAPASARPVGVGIWSTTTTCAGRLDRRLGDLGRWVDRVGYRTPNGDWLARSRLGRANINENGDGNGNGNPGLLFIREDRYLSILRDFVDDQGTAVEMHEGRRIEAIDGGSCNGTGRLVFDDGSTSEDDFHVVVDACGMNSPLRSIYGRDTEGQDFASSGASEDRGYVVIRGTSPLSDVEDGISFQTWGEGKSMRFATVPMREGDGQTWFVTTSDPECVSTKNPEKVKQRILDLFHDWHDPILPLLESTPIDRIWIEKAMAHTHSVLPIPSLSQSGPALCFVGDAKMTVDPVLAQGFSIALEDAHNLANTLERVLSSPATAASYKAVLAEALLQHYYKVSEPRLLCLIRATDLVQVLAQPSEHISFTGVLTTYLLRPLMKALPNVIKKPIFDSMLRYSLGLSLPKKSFIKRNKSTMSSGGSSSSTLGQQPPMA